MAKIGFPAKSGRIASLAKEAADFLLFTFYFYFLLS